MKTNHEEYKMSPFESVLKYFGVLLSLVYVMVGLAMVFRGEELFGISPLWALPLGSMLMVYGVFRAYRLYQKYFR